jgi:hypothetical protein
MKKLDILHKIFILLCKESVDKHWILLYTEAIKKGRKRKMARNENGKQKLEEIELFYSERSLLD